MNPFVPSTNLQASGVKPDANRPLGVAFLCVGIVAVIITTYVSSPIVAVAVVGALILAILSLQYTQLFMLAIFLVMPFPITLFGSQGSYNLSPADCLAFLFLLSLPMYIVAGKRFTLGVVTAPLLIFLSINIMSGLVFWDGWATILTVVRMVMMTVVAVAVFANAGMSLSTMRRCFYSYLIGINLLTLVTLVGFVSGGVREAEFTLGISKNALGSIFGCGIAIALGFLTFRFNEIKTRMWLILTLVGATAGMILSLSRGGWIASTLGVLFLLAATRKYWTFLVLIVVLIPTIGVVWSQLPSEATDYATDLSIKSYNIRTRTVMIEQCMKLYETSPIYGVGVGLRKYTEPHNVFILTLAETGLIGLFCIILLIGSGFYSFVQAYKLTRGQQHAREIVILGATVFLISISHGMMDVYWRRGPGFMAWASVGMCVAITAWCMARRPVVVNSVRAVKPATE